LQDSHPTVQKEGKDEEVQEIQIQMVSQEVFQAMVG
jgi:hypothetical protein